MKQYTNEEAKAIIANDAVIVRNDGVVISNEIGDYRIFVPAYDYWEGRREIERLLKVCQKLNADYTFQLVKYNDLPEDKKYK